MISDAPAKPASRWRGRMLTLACVLAVVLLVFTGYKLFYHPGRSTYSAPAARLAAAGDGVTYLANGGVYVVSEPDGSFIAVDDQDRNRDNRLNACVVRWRGDLRPPVFLEDERCGGATYDRSGHALSSGLDLLRHPARVAGKSVVVDIRQCMAPEQDTVRPCSDFRH